MMGFKRHRELISRPKVSDDIFSQREQLLIVYKEALVEYLRKIDAEEFRDIATDASKQVNDIYNIRHFFYKVDPPTIPSLFFIKLDT